MSETSTPWSAWGISQPTTAELRQFLTALPGVDEVGNQARAAMLASRSLKKESKARALELAVRMTDLTTLEGADTPATVRSLATKAVHPDESDPQCPPVAEIGRAHV